MTRTFVIIAAVFLILHGLVHLMGTAVYTKLTEMEDLPYKTTLMGGQIDLGEAGMRVFGVLWGVAALGFVGSAVGLLGEFEWWRALLLGSTAFSLVLTGLDFSNAYAGIAVNVLILVAMFLGPPLM